MYKVSSYEKKVIEILNREKVKFVKEKTFDDLHHGYYRFDFFLPEKNILLEVQGRQHTEFTKVFYKTRSDFLKAQERDREKNKLLSFSQDSSLLYSLVGYGQNFLSKGLTE